MVVHSSHCMFNGNIFINIVSCFFGNIKQEIQVHHIIDDNREIPSSEVPGADSCNGIVEAPA